MRRLLLTLSFDGTRYSGWQVQKNAPTIQQTLQQTAEIIFGSRPGITGCSRTDSGVHARMFCCHLDTESRIPAERIPAAFNCKLPRDIAVTGAREVPAGFHARYDCVSKRYEYRMYRLPCRDPFLDPYALRLPGNISLTHMQNAAAAFCRRADFSAFCAAGSTVSDHIRTVFECTLNAQNELLTLSVLGDGFLYNMVRIMAGTLIEAGVKRHPPGWIDEIILSRDRGAAGPTAPAKALYLTQVNYPD